MVAVERVGQDVVLGQQEAHGVEQRGRGDDTGVLKHPRDDDTAEGMADEVRLAVAPSCEHIHDACHCLAGRRHGAVLLQGDVWQVEQEELETRCADLLHKLDVRQHSDAQAVAEHGRHGSTGFAFSRRGERRRAVPILDHSSRKFLEAHAVAQDFCDHGDNPASNAIDPERTMYRLDRVSGQPLALHDWVVHVRHVREPYPVGHGVHHFFKLLAILQCNLFWCSIVEKVFGDPLP
mmetsp:Transcript_1172/g.3014  ORF Transcript_1172/g.3014 Transcript_1172/m.3014 type:complete len:235 (+) Transcript_1172:742-1446(+)